ncbi:MAG: LysR family transcriptional regulator [Pseudomonadota bacterium]
MDRFGEMHIFVRIVERRSFTKAATDLMMPRATVSNAIQRLEERLGTRLLERTTRQVKPTLDGEAYYQRCRRILFDLEDADGLFRQTMPKGLLRVNLQGTLARKFIIPALPGFMAAYPELTLLIADSDRYVDLVQEGYDCVVRSGELSDSTMIVRRLTLLPTVTLASPDYFGKIGIPETLDDLTGQDHRAVGYLSGANDRPVPLDFTVGGALRQVMLPASVSVTGADLYMAAGLAGLGLIQVPRYRVIEDLRAGALVEILPEYPPEPMPVSVLYPQNRQLSPRVRAFADWLTALFRTLHFGS